jgi:hypothetical protein
MADGFAVRVRDRKQVKVAEHLGDRMYADGLHWGDPIGAAYSDWTKSTTAERMRLMTETAIELAMQGYDLKSILIEFAKVTEFRALGSASYPMCRALTSALVGKCLEPNTMSFEELLEAYGPPQS